MLSKQVKERIRKNKQRRFQCRKKQGRELHRAMRRARHSTRDFFNIWAGVNKNNRFFDFDKLKDIPISTGFKHFNDMLKGGGFKRGELPLIGAFMTPPLEPYKSDFRGYLISQAIKHGKPIRISLERDSLLDSEFTEKLYRDVKLGGLNTHNSVDNEIIIGLDPGTDDVVERIEGKRYLTIHRGKHRQPLKGGIFDVKMDFSKVRLDDAHLAGDVQAEGRKQDVFDMLALAAKAVIEPQMYRKPDGSLEVMSYNLVAGPSKAPPMPAEMTGVQPLMPEANAELAATLDKFKDVKLENIDANRTRARNPDVP